MSAFAGAARGFAASIRLGGLNRLTRWRVRCSSTLQPTSGMLACTLYISEGRNPMLLQAFEAVARSSPMVALVNTFVDSPYHRTSFTLVSPFPDQVATTASRVAKAAIAAIDLRCHKATHPRLGTVDHISCHPLAPDNNMSHMQEAASMAHLIGAAIGSEPSAAPVFYYGAAHPQGRQLEDLRRSFGYFRGGAAGTWAGAIEDANGPAADCGPEAVDERTGIVAVGATQWISNFNLLLKSQDLLLGRKIARSVSERSGGMPKVQAMALRHEGGNVEVACNLLDYTISGPAEVQAKVDELARQEGTQVETAYLIAPPPEIMIQMAKKALCS